MKNLHEITHENVLEALRKHLDLDFFTETIFLTNFKRILKYQKGWTIYYALFPLFIGEKREVVAAQLVQASRTASTRRHPPSIGTPVRPKWVWFLFAPHFLLNTPPFVFFC